MNKVLYKKFIFRGKKFLLSVDDSSIYCVDEWKAMEQIIQKQGNVQHPKWNHEFREVSPQLQLCISMACNLKCKYCVFRSREVENHSKMMDLDVAYKAIDFFFGSLSKNQRFARIDFGVAGEPFIAEKYHEKLKKYIRQLCKKHNKTIWVGANMSNGLLLKPREMIKRLGSPMDISIDGTREDHDKFRVYKDGKATYDDLCNLISLAKQLKIDIGACSVITAETPDIKKNFKHIFDLGIRASIYMKPVNSTHNEKYSLNKKNLPVFKRGYEEFVDFLLAAPDDLLIQYLGAINPEDYFFRFFYRILNRSVQRYRCNSGKSGAYVDWDGKLYPCAHFVGAKDQEIGDIYKGIIVKKRKLFTDQVVDKRKSCSGCWAKYLCGGGCYYQAWLTNKDIQKPDLVKCDLIKFFIKLQSYFVSELIEKRKEVLMSIENPFFSGAINSVPPQKKGLFYPRNIGTVSSEKTCVNIGDKAFYVRYKNNSLFISIPHKILLPEVSVHIDKNIKNRYQWDEVCFYRDTAAYEHYRFDKNGKVMVAYNTIKNGMIELPFKRNIKMKSVVLKKTTDGSELKIPIRENKIGFNITIKRKNKTYALVPEMFGALHLDSDKGHSTIAPVVSCYMPMNKKELSYLQLWSNEMSSELFKDNNSSMLFDASVC